MSQPIFINGLDLPGALVQLVEGGRWRRPDDVAELRRLTGFADADDLELLGFESMEQNTLGLVEKLDTPGNAQLFGLASSRRAGRPVTDPAVLDVDLAVLIAATFGDGMLCLDYRGRRDRPAVLISDWPAGGVRWRPLFPDIETLALHLRL